jgi:hypothetical protein
MVLAQRQDMKTNRTEDPEINPHSHSHLTFDRGAKSIHWRKGSFFNKCCWKNRLTTCRRLKLDSYLSPCTKINSKWIKDLNGRPKMLKLINRENSERYRHR